MKKAPVSVVMPAFNAEQHIDEALESVLGEPEVGQVIVVDDGSTDSTAARASAHEGVELVQQPNAGIAAARNAGIARATGEYLSFLDADDLWTRGRLRALIGLLESSAVDAAFGYAMEFGTVVEGESPQPALVPGGMLIRTAEFRKVGAFNEELRLGEFVDWWARAQEAGLSHAVTADVVLLRRVHESNTGRLRAEARVDYARLLRAALARRRQAQ